MRSTAKGVSSLHRVQSMPAAPVSVPRRRHPVIPRRSRLIKRRASTLFYTLGFLASAAALCQVSYDFFLRTPYFQLQEVQITGVSDALKREITGLVDAAADKNSGNILLMNAGSLTRLIGQHPRIRDLDLRKVYPNTLVISAKEREAAAYLIAGSNIYIMDWDGHVLDQVTSRQMKDKDLPYLTGIPSDDVQVGEKIYNPNLYKALGLIRVLKDRNQDLYGRMSDIHLSSDPVSHMESITATLTGGMSIRFGDTNPVEKLPSFEVWAETVRQKGQDPYSMAYVDLRFKDRVFHMDRETAMAYQAGILEDLQTEQANQVQPAKSASRTEPKSEGTAASNGRGSARASTRTR